MRMLTRKLGLTRLVDGDVDFGEQLVHWCPGCKSRHVINIEKPNRNAACWTWNGSHDQPTVSPSMNIGPGYCHYIMTAGRLAFCQDCHHDLKGQTVDLPDFPDHILVANGFQP